MIILRFEKGSLDLNLIKCTSLNSVGAYYISIHHHKELNRDNHHTSMLYPKKQAYKIYTKMCNTLVLKSYMSY